jgi:hypothetical protein
LGAVTSTADMPFFAPRLTVARRFGGYLGAELSAGYGRGQAEASLGDVQLDVAELALALFGRFTTGDFEWRLGASARGAWAWIDGRTTQVEVATAAFDAPMFVTTALLGGRYSVSDAWNVELTVEPGWVVRGVRAGVDGSPALRIGGLAIGGAVGVSRSF